MNGPINPCRFVWESWSQPTILFDQPLGRLFCMCFQHQNGKSSQEHISDTFKQFTPAQGTNQMLMVMWEQMKPGSQRRCTEWATNFSHDSWSFSNKTTKLKLHGNTKSQDRGSVTDHTRQQEEKKTPEPKNSTVKGTRDTTPPSIDGQIS